MHQKPRPHRQEATEPASAPAGHPAAGWACSARHQRGTTWPQKPQLGLRDADSWIWGQPHLPTGALTSRGSRSQLTREKVQKSKSQEAGQVSEGCDISCGSTLKSQELQNPSKSHSTWASWASRRPTWSLEMLWSPQTVVLPPHGDGCCRGLAHAKTAGGL